MLTPVRVTPGGRGATPGHPTGRSTLERPRGHPTGRNSPRTWPSPYPRGTPQDMPQDASQDGETPQERPPGMPPGERSRRPGGPTGRQVSPTFLNEYGRIGG